VGGRYSKVGRTTRGALVGRRPDQIVDCRGEEDLRHGEKVKIGRVGIGFEKVGLRVLRGGTKITIKKRKGSGYTQGGREPNSQGLRGG